MRRAPIALLLPILVTACGGVDENNDGIVDGAKDPNSVSLVAPSTPIGTLSGQVLTTRLAPLADAQVSLNVGGQTGAAGAPFKTNTDAEGNFFFAGLPAGAQVLVTMSKAGYATLRSTVTVPSSAGNFPINDGNVSVGPYLLTQLNGSVKFMVITRTGKPAKGARATLEASPSGTLLSNSAATYGSGMGVVVADGTVDDQGMLTFSGIPSMEELNRLNGNYDVTISALDENNDGDPEFLGTFQRFGVRSLVTDSSIRVITLADARVTTGLAVVASNVESMISNSTAPARNMVKPGESLYFVFNQEVLDSSLTVRLTDEYGQQSIVISKALRVGTALTVTPPTPLESGKEYNISIRATSLENGSTFSRAGYVFGADPNAPKPFAVFTIQYRDGVPNNATLNAGEQVILTFNQPIRLIGSTPAEAFIDYDFDASGTKGDYPGEKGATTGFNISAFEPTNEKDTLFSLQASNYTSRYQFTFSGALVGVPNNTQISVAFGKLLNATSGYQSIWGTPVTAEESAGVTVAPAP